MSVLSVVAALALTLGLLLLTLRGLGALQRRVASGGRIPLAVIQRVALGPRHGVGLLRVGDRVLVVALGEQGATLLTELTGDTLRQALAEPMPGTRGPGSLAPMDGVRSGVLRRWWPLVLAAVLPSVAAAQDSVPRTPPPPVVVERVPIAPVGPPPAAQEPAGRRAVPTPTVQPPRAPRVEFRLFEGRNELRLSGTVGLVVFLGALTLIPALVLLMTSFTRILIVLHFLRAALGTQTTPPGQLLIALAVLLTGVVMHPVLERVNREALTPYFDGAIDQVEVYRRGLVPFREFMLANVREQDLGTFAEMSGVAEVASVEELPTTTVVAAFVSSELRTAFQMGFVIFLPFIVVDLIVASVLMSMGMMMLPPVMVSLPFKLLLFVLADGWTLVVQNLVASFRV